MAEWVPVATATGWLCPLERHRKCVARHAEAPSNPWHTGWDWAVVTIFAFAVNLVGDKYLNKRRLHWLGRKLTDLLSYEKYICGTFFFVCVFVFPSIISSPLHNIFSVWHRSLLHTLVLPFLNTYSLSCLNWFFWSSCHFDLETLFFHLQDVPQRGTESGEGAGLHLWLKMLKMSLLLELATKTGEERTENLTWTKQALTWRSDCVSI